MLSNKEKLYTTSFTLLVAGQIISLFGSAIQRFALSLYILEMTGSATIFASILAFSIVPIVVLSPFAGIMADRFNKRNIMVILDLISAAIMAIYGAILWSDHDNAMIVAIMMLLLSGISTLYQPSVTSSIPLLATEENLMKANGVVQQVSSLSNFLGPIIAGLLYGFIGIKGVVLINLVSFFASAIMECFIKISFTKPEKVHSPIKLFVNEIKDSYHYLKNENRVIFRMSITSGLYNLFLVPLLSVGAPYIIKVFLNQSSKAYGFSEGAIAFGMIIGALIVGRFPNRFRIRRIYRVLFFASVCMAMMALSLFLCDGSSTQQFYAYLAFTFFAMGIMITIGMGNVVSATYTQQATPNNMLGKISAFGVAFATICVPFGQIMFGWLLDIMMNHIWLMVLFSSIATLFVTMLVRYNVLQIEE